MGSAEKVIESIRPSSNEAIMDLVREAGVDVKPWTVKADGTEVRNPRANPNYCYNWAFGGGAEPTVLCIWHEDIRVEVDAIVYSSNYQQVARKLEEVVGEIRADNKVVSRAKAQAKRAWGFDKKLQHAYRKGQPIRFVLLIGDRRDEAAFGMDAAHVAMRSLDSEPWFVDSYDDGSGAFKLTRGSHADASTEADDAFERVSQLTVDEFANAIMNIDSRITPQQREMLIGHALAQNQTLSMSKIAALGMYSNYEAGNSQYGRLGGMLAEALGITGLANKVQAISVSSLNNDELGHFEWKIRPQVVEALIVLGMIPEQSKLNEVADAPSPNEDDSSEFDNELPTVRQALIDARLGQGAYRKKMLRQWGRACAVTGCAVEKVLVASHALPWRHSSSRERLDHFNGLLLTATLDRLFDSGLIAFTDDGALLVSNVLDKASKELLGLRDGIQLRQVDMRMIPYLKAHRRLHGFTEAK